MNGEVRFDSSRNNPSPLSDNEFRVNVFAGGKMKVEFMVDLSRPGTQVGTFLKAINAFGCIIKSIGPNDKSLSITQLDQFSESPNIQAVMLSKPLWPFDYKTNSGPVSHSDPIPDKPVSEKKLLNPAGDEFQFLNPFTHVYTCNVGRVVTSSSGETAKQATKLKH